MKQYTYRCGEKLELDKNPQQFVVRALPDQLKEMGLNELEQVSSASTKITTTSYNLETAMGTCRGIATTHHVYQIKETGEDFLITDRVFVRFKKAPENNVLNKFIAKYNLSLIRQYSDKECLFQLTNHTGMNPVKLVVLLTEKEPLVKSAGHDLNRLIKKYERLIPADPQYVKQWHLHERLIHAKYDPRASARCEKAWTLLGSYGDENVVVALADDGCRLDHTDFDSGNKFAAWAYFRGSVLIDNTEVGARPELMYDRGSDHGTSCSGVIAGEVDAVKTVGAAPACKLLPIKWESNGPEVFISDSKLITVLEFIADKADVMSNSWGSSPEGIWENEVLNTIRKLSVSGGRRGKGIVFLWAAGNENCPIEHNSPVGVPFTSGTRWGMDGSRSWVGVRTAKSFRHNLSDLPGVMFIAALASTARRSHYSNYGTGISLSAPSSNKHTYFRMIVDGLGITTTTGSGNGIRNHFGGTSSATPLVAGVAALVISANPDLEAKAVISILKSTASKDLIFEAYPKTPPSAYDPDTSWDVSPVAPFDKGNFVETDSPEGSWSPWFGYGKVDALEAVKAALGKTESPALDTIRKASEPALAIPDNDSGGIADNIEVSESGTLTSIKVAVDIVHTFIGDLIVSLTSPSGTEVLLHNRNGGPGSNLLKTFDVDNAAFLNDVIGEPIKGNWQLSVRDMAHIDIGTLKSWRIELGMENTKDVIVEESPGLSIPDNLSTGIERTLTITKSGRIKSIELDLDITHTYISDLFVELTSPRSGSFVLHNRSGGDKDNLIRNFTMTNTPALFDLNRKSVKGDWKLRIVDMAAADRGKLNYWKIKFELM